MGSESRNESIASDAGTDGYFRTNLACVSDLLSGLEKSVTEESVRRRQQADQRLKDMRDTIVRLEKALNSEIKRRVEANKTLQTITEHMANEMLGRVSTKVLRRIDELAVLLEGLITRCEAIELCVHELKGAIPSKLQTELVAITREVFEVRESLEAQRKLRTDRERIVSRRVAEIGHVMQTKIENEAAERKSQMLLLKQQVETMRSDGHSRSDKFRSFAMEELAAIRIAIETQAKEREESDDEIIQAINHYTTALQKGLRHANL